ncbi:MAG TPA: choice-of-anchor tandem repeat GloVer-containing protein [Rhizomicrobium sp.]|jgi:uncharacterized repeat protein (TIGR03803 family)
MKMGLPILAAGALVLASAESASAGYTEKSLHDFCSKANCKDGGIPIAGLLADSSGDLYGTADEGGTGADGLVFELVPDAGKYKFSVLHDFGTDGLMYPESGLIRDKKGSLYGTAHQGGGNGYGAVYRLSYNGSKWKLTALHQFSGGDGEYPATGLTYAGQASGNAWDGFSPLFGTASEGGTYGNGVAYELVRNGSAWTETVIHNFEDSQAPNELLEDTAGNLWGTARLGGKYGGGLMYKLASGTWNQTVVHNFCNTQNCADGYEPEGRLYMDSARNVFGVTAEGGANCQDRGGCGVVFERTSGGTYGVIYNFCLLANCTDGTSPLAGLLADGSGHLLGTTFWGGSNCQNDGGCGTVFRLTNKNGTWSESAAYSFCAKPDCSDGDSPLAPLMMDAHGSFFGTTAYANNGFGNVFELEPK